MKINTADFFVENNIVSATEQELVYEFPRNRMQEVWDKLGVYYSNKSKEENKTDLQLEEFYNMLYKAKQENEVAAETFKLMQQTVLKSYPSSEYKEQHVDIKETIRMDVLKILGNRLEELERNIVEEEKVYKQLKEINFDVRVTNQTLRVYTSPFDSVEFKPESEDYAADDQNDGLFCVLKFKDQEYRGFHKTTTRNKYEKVDYKKYEGCYESTNVKISLQNEYSEQRNPVCDAIIYEVVSGRSIKAIFSAIPVLLSRFHLSNLLSTMKVKKILETKTEKLEDGLSAVFYVITDSGVIKLQRESDSFDVYLNGKSVL